jgi:2-polyprenyl-3-methyl-5-hydroxy-6-metoxy-1,4-benzoquinol methylase
MVLHEVSCNLCGSRRSKVRFSRPYADQSLTQDFIASTDVYANYGRIVRCLDCGLVYTNPRPSAADLLAGYGSCIDDTYLMESSSRSINAHFSLNTIKSYIQSGRLLEVGSSTGYFLNAARVDFEVSGLEPSRWACQLAKDKFKLDVYPEDIEGIQRFGSGHFDVIAMIDVLEHLADPKRAIELIREALKPGGLLYFVTPDIGSLSAGMLRSRWWGLRPAHIHYFNSKTLRRLLETNGFRIQSSSSFGRIFSYGYWASRLRNYPALIYLGLTKAIRLFGVEKKFLYLNTRDSIEVCARKI